MSDEIMEDFPASRMAFVIDNRRPVVATVYAQSLEALGNEYRRYLAAFHPDADAEHTQMCISEVRAGSILSVLAPVVVGALPFFDAAKTAVEYADYLKAVVEWALGKSGEKPKLADEAKTMKDMVKILEPTARDQGSQMNIGTVTIHGDLNITFGVGSLEANAAQNHFKRLLEPAKPTPGGEHKMVALRWYQTRGDTKAKTGDKARIESIYPDPVKVIFASPDLKERMVLSESQIYERAFIVDVSVETVDGKPIAYVVKTYHEEIDLAS
ncbi:hypothetical protein PPL19_05310 [Pseudomonas psychrotolerans L19]|uniref:hypothetical protein n=1 Tax=Pseudomonas oryzihabitans TaxID=47885 RepID=UPI00023A2A6F|nr:hypothetical protein [Pseudomonas psychrotolerans]EHK72331.1 hypothetical protein PPL19_05310 [Pseudomonas psychrotolerans L19]